jgi:hypothetical protein
MSNLHKPKSSTIAHIDYHGDLTTLEICFANGSTYHYPNCPKIEYERLKAAESCGKHFQSVIRPRFKGKKID